MSPRYDENWIANMLDAPSRIGSNQPDELLAKAGLGEGRTVIDLGCGPGFLTFPAATIVGTSGRVYAIDTEQSMLDIIQNRADELNLGNVQTVSTNGDGVSLPNDVADYAICGLILHDPPTYEGRVAMAQDIGRMLRLGGQALIIDRGPEPGDSHGHQLTPSDAKAIMQEAGFECDEHQPLVGDNYMMVATLKASG